MSRGCPQLVLRALEFLSGPLPQALWLHSSAASGDIRTKLWRRAPRAPEPSVHGVHKTRDRLRQCGDWLTGQEPHGFLKKTRHRSKSFHVRIADSSSPTLTLIPPQVMLPKGMHGRVPLLVTQKPVNRQVGGKESLLYYRSQQPKRRADSCL